MLEPMTNEQFVKWIENLIDVKIAIAERQHNSDFRSVKYLRAEELEPIRKDFIKALDEATDNSKGS